MSTATQNLNDVFPHIDAATQECITDEQAGFFRKNGLLLIRNVLRGEELKSLQDQTLPFVEKAMASKVIDPDYFYTKHAATKQEIPFRIEFVVDKTKAGKALGGHPFILKSVEKLQGRNFIPTWDSMVFKKPGAGAAIAWHRDAGVNNDYHGPQIFNVDFYLDGSDLSNCLWGIPGSNLWSADEAGERIKFLNGGKDVDFTMSTGGNFKFDGAVPIPVNPGDVLLHDVLALHGSPPAESKLRRVLYYEYRPMLAELNHGPHTLEYVAKKQRMLLHMLRDRAQADYVDKSEQSYLYNPESAYGVLPLAENEKLESYRYAHADYWRK